MIRAVVLDDEELVRTGFRLILEAGDVEAVATTLRAGAAGFILKDSGPEQLSPKAGLLDCSREPV
jgi:DNA-binding NarL/FixJ family response regulator